MDLPTKRISLKNSTIMQRAKMFGMTESCRRREMRREIVCQKCFRLSNRHQKRNLHSGLIPRRPLIKIVSAKILSKANYFSALKIAIFHLKFVSGLVIINLYYMVNKTQ